MAKNITVGYAALTSCSGCEIALLDINEKILDVLKNAELVYGPLIMDAREVPDNIDLLFVEGSVSTDHDLQQAQEYRKKAKYLVAVGACACFGGIPGMRNFFERNEILADVYPLKDKSEFLGPTQLSSKVQSLPMVVKTDFFVPGCPPLPENFLTVIQNYPNFDRIKLPTKTLCAECDLNKDKLLSPIREFTSLKIKNPYHFNEEEENLCFLERGILCMGVATRAGCGGRCVKVSVPCRGCFGPPPQEGSEDQGAGVISAISSILPTGRLLTKEDMLGLVYRYSLSVITDLQKYFHE
ncbi:MAG: F420-nonreducing hydrogenase [Candidatus Heimdallarchaeota archaeon]|nr:MAG: F420-nonreducing hydrogenase [Candidatus Heimdallarchaeota archaeon]